MCLSISKQANLNYLAHIVELSSIKLHPDANKLQVAEILNTTVITGLEAKQGDVYVYFPVESQLSGKFLKWSNAYAECGLNKDVTQKGFFGSNGRVRMIKLRGLYSDGYIVPYSSFELFVAEEYGVFMSYGVIGCKFDSVCGDIFINKYIPKTQGHGKVKNHEKSKPKFKRLLDHQFAFHPDTENLRNKLGDVSPFDYISITNKYHGCNCAVANILTNRPLSWVEKIAKFLKVKVVDKEYGMIYSSRTVVRNAEGHSKDGLKFTASVQSNVWKEVAEEIYPYLDKGIRVTGEIIGYDGYKEIQPKYDYGLTPGNHMFLVFKIDAVNVDGESYTFSHPQMVEYCKKKGLRMVDSYYYGLAKDLFDIPVDSDWHSNFIKKLSSEYLGKRDPLCSKDVPMEGVVISKEVPLHWNALKLKDLEFLGYETKMLDDDQHGAE